MKRTILLALCILAGSLLAAQSQPNTLNATAPLPPGSNLLQRVLERFTNLVAQSNAPVWAYDKKQILEELDSGSKVKERTVKHYHTRIVQGMPISQLIKIEGRNLTEAELKKEDQSDKAFELEISGRAPKKSDKKRESFIPKNLIDSFDFKTLRREPVQGRLTVVMTFAGKPRKDDGSMADRLMSRMAGTLWIDETTAEIARMEIHLTKDLSIGVLGILGAIKDCKMDATFKSLPGGSWLPETIHIAISARIFLSSMRFQVEETSSNYKLETPAK